MVDFETQTLIEEIVDKKVKSRSLFTAFDITLEAKEKGFTGRHREVKDLIHTFYETGGFGLAYKREAITVAGTNDKPWLYLPKWENTSTYKPLDRSKFRDKAVVKPAISNVIPIKPVVSSGDGFTLGTLAANFGLSIDPNNKNVAVVGKALVGDVTTDADDTLYSVDSRDRICIPKKLVQGLGLSHGDAAYLVITSGSVQILKNFTAYSNYRVYFVDKSCNVRVEQKVLVLAGIGGSMYKINGDSNSITITK